MWYTGLVVRGYRPNSGGDRPNRVGDTGLVIGRYRLCRVGYTGLVVGGNRPNVQGVYRHSRVGNTGHSWGEGGDLDRPSIWEIQAY